MAMKKVEMALDEVKAGLVAAIQERLIQATSKTGNTYFTLPERNEPLVIGELTGSFNVSWNDLKPAGDVAAATVERADAVIARMSAEQKREWLEKQLAEL
jgi:hypothetical protein